MAIRQASRATILAAIAEWSSNPDAFLQAVGRKAARTVYIRDKSSPAADYAPLKAIATRVLGDQGPGWTTRRYEDALDPESFGFHVTTLQVGQTIPWISADEEDLDRVEGEPFQAVLLKRRRCRAIVQKFKERRLRDQKLACDDCGVSAAALSRDEIPVADRPSLFDADHKTPIGHGERRTRITDLQLLCPNCHRFRHVRDRIGPTPAGA